MSRDMKPRLQAVRLGPRDLAPLAEDHELWGRSHWRARWLLPPRGAAAPFVAAYRLMARFEAAARLRIHVSADQRYRLFCDGADAGVGPERGDPLHWRFHSFGVELEAGEHVLAAMVWCLGPHGSVGQPSVAPGFLLAAEGPWHERLSTGCAAWECRLLDCYSFEGQPAAPCTGERCVIEGSRLPWGWQSGMGGGFAAAPVGPAACCALTTWSPRPPILVPARLPPLLDEIVPNGTAVLVDAVDDPYADTPAAAPAGDLPEERAAWQEFLAGRAPLCLEPGRVRRCLVELGGYRAVWPFLTAAGAGGRVRLRYAEALFVRAVDSSARREKGDRRVWAGKFLRGVGPVLRTAPGEPQTYLPTDWECGRYLEILAAAGSEPLVMQRLVQRATGYAFADEGRFASDDPRLERVRERCDATIRVGTQDIYQDNPYFERQQYVDDARVQCLVTYCMQADDRLQRQVIDAIAASRLPDGMPQSRGPARDLQVIPPYALAWIRMLGEFARWRGDAAFVRGHLPLARGILDAWWALRRADGLIESPVGFNFVDWVTDDAATGWKCGMPRGAARGVSGLLNWHCAGTLVLAAGLEDAFGEPEIAALHRRRAAALAASAQAFWDERRGRWLDALGAQAASEHGQIFPLLSGLLEGEQARRTAASLAHDDDLVRATIYFTHYLFEAYRQMGRADLLFSRLGLWFGLEESGLVTTPECPEPTRADCQPWSAHPLYHLAATVAGIRPAAYGFARAEVLPQPGPLRRLNARVPHPAGAIVLEIEHRADSFWHGRLTTPVPTRTPSGDLAPGEHPVRWRLAAPGISSSPADG